MWLLFSLGCSSLCKECETELAQVREKYSECEDFLDYKDFNESPTWDDLLTIFFQDSFGPQLNRELNEEIRIQAQRIFIESNSWELQHRNKQLNIARLWANSVDKTEWDAGLKDVLRWASFLSYGYDNSGFVAKVDSNNTLVCYRGFMSLNYRQATQLGIQAQPDAVYVGAKKGISSSKQRTAQLYRALETSGVDQSLWPTAYQNNETSIASTRIPLNPQQFCISQEGEDEREFPTKVKKALNNLFQHKSLKNAPTLGKLASIYAADLQGHHFFEEDYISPISLTGSLTHELDHVDISGSEWVHQQLARSIANAVVTPCTILLNGSEEIKEKFFPAKKPNPVVCSYIYWAAQHENY